jgi:hypothetical protein
MRALGASIGDNQIGDIAQKETNQYAPHHDFRSSLPFRLTKQFGDDVENRTGSQGEKKNEHLGRMEDDAHHRSQEGGTPADESQERHELPGNGLTAKRTGDAKSFGHIVQTKANNQHHGELEGSRRGGLSDRQPFGEVVETNAGSDEESQRAGSVFCLLCQSGHAG